MYNPAPAWKDKTPVARAVHLFRCFYPWRAMEICKEEGISEEEVKRGALVAEELRKIDRDMRCQFGDPAYGSWPEYAADVLNKELVERGITREEAGYEPHPEARR